MRKIVIITDIHANLPALEAVLKTIRAEGYDSLIQTGDVIGIGPYPRECLDLILSTPGTENITGNHEVYFANGLLDSLPVNVSPGEVQHHRWTHACLTKEHKSIIANWPFIIKHTFEGVQVAFLHSGLGKSGDDIQGIPRNASEADLDLLFASHDADLVFFGHRHENSDVQGHARYINPGSLGCHHNATARYCVAEFTHGRYKVKHCFVDYDDTGLIKTFEERQVPDRDFIYRAFFGGRFQ